MQQNQRRSGRTAAILQQWIVPHGICSGRLIFPMVQAFSTAAECETIPKKKARQRGALRAQASLGEVGAFPKIFNPTLFATQVQVEQFPHPASGRKHFDHRCNEHQENLLPSPKHWSAMFQRLHPDCGPARNILDLRVKSDLADVEGARHCAPAWRIARLRVLRSRVPAVSFRFFKGKTYNPMEKTGFNTGRVN